jgi:hypothetical protein
MLLFLLASGISAQETTEDIAGKETFSLVGNANTSLYAVIPSKITNELAKSIPIPFEEDMLISYQFPKAMDVEFTIYDKSGRELRNIVRENKPAGSYSINLAAENLKAGVYFYKLVVGNDIDVKKVLLVK